MLRTQIYLPKTLYQQVQLLAKKANIPTAEMVRELLAEGLKRKHGTETIGKALQKLADLHAKGPADLSTSIDKYLYEDA